MPATSPVPCAASCATRRRRRASRCRSRRHHAPGAREGVPDLDRRGVVHRARPARRLRARARQIRESLGNPKQILLGVDRLDYTKGIRHRLKAFGELLDDGKLSVEDVTLVQVASPSRERVDAYMQLRDEIELMVGRINGDYDTMGHTAIRYLHQAYPREEMVALYLAADVMLVTALRDGMNLVAKEYVAARIDNRGVLVLSEFAGAADELGSAMRINPHDIDGLKDAIMRAIEMPPGEQGRRMRRCGAACSRTTSRTGRATSSMRSRRSTRARAMTDEQRRTR